MIVFPFCLDRTSSRDLTALGVALEELAELKRKFLSGAMKYRLYMRGASRISKRIRALEAGVQ